MIARFAFQNFIVSKTLSQSLHQQIFRNPIKPKRNLLSRQRIKSQNRLQFIRKLFQNLMRLHVTSRNKKQAILVFHRKLTDRPNSFTSFYKQTIRVQKSLKSSIEIFTRKFQVTAATDSVIGHNRNPRVQTHSIKNVFNFTI